MKWTGEERSDMENRESRKKRRGRERCKWQRKRCKKRREERRKGRETKMGDTVRKSKVELSNLSSNQELDEKTDMETVGNS